MAECFDRSHGNRILFHRIREVKHVTRVDLRQVMSTAVKFVAGSFGPFAQDLWPYSGVITVSLLLATAVILARDLYTHRLRRDSRTLSSMLFAAGSACLASSAGVVRS